MRVLSSIEDLPRDERVALAVGMFDGVHRGHQRVLRALVAAAARHDARAVVVSFDRHPAVALGKGPAPLLLCDPSEKLERLAELGVDATVVALFDREFAAQPPADFLLRVADGRELAALVMTGESAFGRGRSGTLSTIEQLAPSLGFEIVAPAELPSRGERVSSTRIRAAVTAGRLAAAKQMLGRPYAVTGTIVHGDARGRELGYPTANFGFDEPVALPPNGVYAVRVGWGGEQLLSPDRQADGVASLGVRPTFGGGERVLEAFLFDFAGDLYGKRMRLEFIRHQRGERRFGSVESLISQMDRDAQRARRILAGSAHSSAAPSASPSRARTASE